MVSYQKKQKIANQVAALVADAPKTLYCDWVVDPVDKLTLARLPSIPHVVVTTTMKPDPNFYYVGDSCHNYYFVKLNRYLPHYQHHLHSHPELRQKEYCHCRVELDLCDFCRCGHLPPDQYVETIGCWEWCSF